MNAVFRVYKYPVTYAAFTGKTLTPGDFVEKYTTDVKINSSGIPENFELMQNYPNPFNPVTRIQYNVPTNSQVKLSVYDILGKEIKVLTDEVKAPGTYEAEFNASNLSSGVYFYMLKAGGFTIVKKMTLMK